MTAHTVPATDRLTSGRRGILTRLFLGERADPVWARPTLWGLLVVTGILYLWNLAASGNANTFYAAAVQAGSEDWKALFFGSLDSSNFITVDKPPASLWVMGLSARIFGFSAWSVLAPQALMGVASVALLFGAVRRSLLTFGAVLSNIGGLIAGLVLAFTPAAALMFRFDNPDALLVLLMTAAAYFVVRSLPKAAWRWLALAGVALGFAFLTKMLQGLLVLPAFGLVYLLAAPTTIWRRLVHLLIAAGSLIVGAGWWLVIVALFPADARPYIGGSTDNTVLDLVFGYNGFGRIFGSSAGGGGGAGGGTGTAGSSFGGATGLNRLFSSEMGLEISWLLPAALIALVLGLIVTLRRGRSDALRSGFVIWGGWLVVTGLLFSFMSGTIHPYYTVALAPAIAGLVAMGGITLWTMRTTWVGRLGLAAMILVSGGWAFHLLATNADWLPWLRWVLLAGSVLSALAILIGSLLELNRVMTVAVLAGTLFSVGGSAAYAIATASVTHSGSIPSVGPASTSGGGMGGGGFGGGTGGAPTGDGGGFGGGTPPSGDGGGTPPSDETGTAPDGTTGTGTTDTGTDGGTTTDGTATTDGGADSTSSADLDALLQATTSRWAAAVNGSQSAAGLELSSDTAVMAIGGWSGDPTPTLAQFKAYVAAGDVSYYIASGQGGGGGGSAGGSSSASDISTWVAATFTATTVGGSTVYDLTGYTG
ncbi:glycosyltransferase family 39 protein [Glaciihabitans sp. dw_435]|uniref:ArnT family glycosyltransferase n=1 Tax=Glaciihabitans sp. dw_435 TaxID=2720081 RepID=UPI001BD22AEA|nr:glycosyltransferase family 39 protein [Glaciihabitans sp. dw_435]